MINDSDSSVFKVNIKFPFYIETEIIHVCLMVEFQQNCDCYTVANQWSGICFVLYWKVTLVFQLQSD